MARPFHDALGSELSVNNVFQGVVHQSQVSIHALESAVLVVQFAQLRQVRNRHARVVALSLVMRRLAYTVSAAGLANLSA